MWRIQKIKQKVTFSFACKNYVTNTIKKIIYINL